MRASEAAPGSDQMLSDRMLSLKAMSEARFSVYSVLLPRSANRAAHCHCEGSPMNREEMIEQLARIEVAVAALRFDRPGGIPAKDQEDARITVEH
jgi:hypothetical protein